MKTSAPASGAVPSALNPPTTRTSPEASNVAVCASRGWWSGATGSAPAVDTTKTESVAVVHPSTLQPPTTRMLPSLVLVAVWAARPESETVKVGKGEGDEYVGVGTGPVGAQPHTTKAASNAPTPARLTLIDPSPEPQSIELVKCPITIVCETQSATNCSTVQPSMALSGDERKAEMGQSCTPDPSRARALGRRLRRTRADDL